VWHPEPDRLVLASLPAEQADPDVLGHLTTCRHCREHVAAMRHTVELARSDEGAAGDGVAGEADSEYAAEPPPHLWQSIMRELGTEVDGPDRPAHPDAPSRSAGPTAAGGHPRWSERMRRGARRAATVPVAAGLIGIAAGLGLGLALSPTPSVPDVPLASLQPVAPDAAVASGAAGLVDRNGTPEIVVTIDGVVGTAGGDYLEAWLMDSSGTRLFSLGALTPDADGGQFTGVFPLPDGLPTEEFGVVDISVENYDGDPTHSRNSLVRGPVL
jgi:hypothetical protein